MARKQKRKEPPLAVKLEHVVTPDGEERLRQAYNLILRSRATRDHKGGIDEPPTGCCRRTYRGHAI